jgi:SET domain
LRLAMARVSDSACGKTLVALEAYQAGDVLFEEEPEWFVSGTDANAYYRLTDMLLENGVHEKYLTQFGARVHHIAVESYQKEDRKRYLQTAIQKYPSVPIPRLLDVVGALNLRTREGITGIYPTLNYINHSCSHNVRLVTPPERPTVFRVVARRPIEKGDELTLTYVTLLRDDDDIDADFCDIIETKEERQRALESEYGFLCCCAVCRA